MLGRRQRKWSLPRRLPATGRRGLWSGGEKKEELQTARRGTEARRELSAEEGRHVPRPLQVPGGALHSLWTEALRAREHRAVGGKGQAGV